MEILSHINYQFWILQTIAMGLTALLIPNLRITSIFGGFLAVVALALINAHLWDAALFFAVPDSFTARAALLVFFNGIIFWATVKILPGIELTGFLPAIVAPVVFTLCSILVDTYAMKVDWKALGNTALEYVQVAKEKVQDSSEKPAEASHE